METRNFERKRRCGMMEPLHSPRVFLMQAMLQRSTSTLLLAGLADSNNSVVWEEFDARYRPIVFGYARRLGLSEEEAADAAQDAMVRFVQEYRLGKYDRARGRLRSWLIGIVKARAIDVLRAKARRREARGDSVLMCRSMRSAASP